MEVEFEYPLIPDLDAYLERIGYKGTRELTRENLNELIYCHQVNVPFESLDISLYNKPLSLEIPHLYEKIVKNRRGGYCFELNGLFVSLLRTFGFDAASVFCRLQGPGFEPQGLCLHRGCWIKLNGKEYFGDVGYGAGAMAPFAVELSSEPQTFYGETFWIEDGQWGWKNLMRKRRSGLGDDGVADEAVMTVLRFAPMAFPSVDFLPLNAMTSSPESKFSVEPWATARTANGYTLLIGNKLTVVENRVRTVTEVTPEELPAKLWELYGLKECEYTC